MSKESEEFVQEILCKDSEKVENALTCLLKTIDGINSGETKCSLKTKRYIVNLANGYIAGLCMNKTTETVDWELYHEYKFKLRGGKISGYGVLEEKPDKPDKRIALM
jgi:hypothetical protein